MIIGYRDRTPQSLPNAGALVNVPIFSGLPYITVDSISGLGAWRPMRYPGPAPMMTRRSAIPRLPGLVLGQSAHTIRSYGQPHPPLTRGQAAWLAGTNHRQGARVGIVGWSGEGDAVLAAPVSIPQTTGVSTPPARPAPSPGGSGRLSGFFMNLFSRQ